VLGRKIGDGMDGHGTLFTRRFAAMAMEALTGTSIET
jgi:hypothetical protein